MAVGLGNLPIFVTRNRRQLQAKERALPLSALLRVELGRHRSRQPLCYHAVSLPAKRAFTLLTRRRTPRQNKSILDEQAHGLLAHLLVQTPWQQLPDAT